MNGAASIFFGIILIAVLVLAGIFGLGYLNNTAADKYAARAHEVYSRYQGEASVIRAKGDSRLDSAQAYSERVQAGAAAFSERSLSAAQSFSMGLTSSTHSVAVTMALTLLGIGVVGTIGIVIVAIFLLGMLANARNKLPPPTQTLFVLQPGQSRREMYQQISAAYALRSPETPGGTRLFYRG